MPDLKRYLLQNLELSGTAVDVQPESVALGGDFGEEPLYAGGRLAPNKIQVMSKQPFIRFSTRALDAIAALAWGEFGTAKPVTSVAVKFRAFDSVGGLGAGYKSYTLAGGILVPLSLSGDYRTPALINWHVRPFFTAGNAWTLATTSGSAAVISPRAYVPKSLTVTSSIVDLRSLNVEWNYEVDLDEQYEPDHYVYTRFTKRVTAVCKDVAEMTLARLEDGAVESVTAVFEDLNAGGSDITVALGNCRVKLSSTGNDVTINAETVENT